MPMLDGNDSAPNELPTCNECGDTMWLDNYDPISDCNGRRSYKCPACGVIETGSVLVTSLLPRNT
jgi:tRNA(Ile2) C34 agmatinyltransferase TiaS